MLVKLIIGGVFIFAALQLWNSSKGSPKSYQKIIAAALGISGLIILLPTLISFTIYGIITIAIVLIMFALVRVFYNVP